MLADLGPAAPLFVAAVLGPLLGAALLAATAPQWLPWFGPDVGSAVGFGLGAAVAAAACLLPTHATSLVAGYLFGAAAGAVVAWSVVLTAAALGYASLRPLVGERALQALAGSPRALALHRALLGAGFWRSASLIALVRLSPVLPFAATNLLLAAFGVRGGTFLLATVVGVTPRAVGAAWVGAGLSQLDWDAGSAPWTTVLTIVATVAALLVVGRIARGALRRQLAPLDPGQA